MKFDLLKVGHCNHPECVAMRGGRKSSIEFPALVGLMEHPQHGLMLYDTGYSKHFWEATRSFPECLYRMVTPPMLPPEEELLSQLGERNIHADQIHTIFISHFHGDHVAGLRDFPNARFISSREEYEEMRGKDRVTQLRNAYLAGLLPENFDERVTYAETRPVIATGLAGFEEGYDLLGDASVMGIPLPGHTRSHLGLLFTDELERRIFLIGDACWKMEALEGKRLPSKIASFLFADNQSYEETFHRLAHLHAADPSVTILPSHCSSSWQLHGNTCHVSHG